MSSIRRQDFKGLQPEVPSANLRQTLSSCRAHHPHGLTSQLTPWYCSMQGQ